MPQIIRRPARFGIFAEHHPLVVPAGEEIIAERGGIDTKTDRRPKQVDRF